MAPPRDRHIVDLLMKRPRDLNPVWFSFSTPWKGIRHLEKDKWILAIIFEKKNIESEINTILMNK